MQCFGGLRRLASEGISVWTLDFADPVIGKEQALHYLSWSAPFIGWISWVSALGCAFFSYYDYQNYSETFQINVVVRCVFAAALIAIGALHLHPRTRGNAELLRTVRIPGYLVLFSCTQVPRIIAFAGHENLYSPSTIAPLLLFGIASTATQRFPQIVLILHALSLVNSALELALVGTSRIVVVSAVVMQAVTLE
jgi:hypothetical protein